MPISWRVGSFFIEAFIYFWDWSLHPRVPIRSALQPLPSGQVPWEGGRETLTGLFSKATKVLSMPMLKPAEPALQKFIQQVRMPAGPRLSVCPLPWLLRLCGQPDQSGAGAGDQGAELER